MSKHTLAIIASVVLVLIVGLVILANRNTSQAPTVNNENSDVAPTVSTTTEASPAAATSPTATEEATMGAVKEFTVEGNNFSFSPTTMTVKKGDTVRVTFKNIVGMHDWKIDEFKAATKVINAGQEETIEFVADKTGSFEYYCSVGKHREMGMKGTLVVQ